MSSVPDSPPPPRDAPRGLAATALHKARAFARLPRFDRAMVLPAWLLLGAGRAAVLAVPFRHLAARMGEVGGPGDVTRQVSDAQALRARQVGRVIHLAARYAPWNSNCFAQALAARMLLGAFGVPGVIFFGVAHEGSGATRELVAHAWVRSGSVAVSGGAGERYAVVASFAWPRTAGRAP